MALTDIEFDLGQDMIQTEARGMVVSLVDILYDDNITDNLTIENCTTFG